MTGWLLLVITPGLSAAELNLVDGRILICQGLSYNEDGATVILADKPPQLVPWTLIAPNSLRDEHRQLQRSLIENQLQSARKFAKQDPARANRLILSLRPFMESVDDSIRESYQWIEAQAYVASKGNRVEEPPSPPPPSPVNEENPVTKKTLMDSINEAKSAFLEKPLWQKLVIPAAILALLVFLSIQRARR